MKVLRVINNNVVSCIDDSGHEAVAMGRGLGYFAKPDTVLDETRVEKIFRMTNRSETVRLEALFANLPPDLIELCTRIIAYATENLNNRLNPSVYLTLTDHVSFSIDRIRQGIPLQNAPLYEVRTFYPQEFAIGKYALNMIEKERGIRLPEDEAASIALHLINAEYDSSLSETLHTTQALHDILDLLRGSSGIQLQEDSIHYNELVSHLKFLVLDVFSDSDSWEHTTEEPNCSDVIKQYYPVEYVCAESIADYLEEKSGHKISPEKRSYLAMSIHHVNLKKS